MPLLLTYYAIRHRPSGAFMPAKMFRIASGGFTWWEPGKEGYEGHSKLPRLFPDRHAAAVALTMWLKGPAEKHYEDLGDDPFFGPSGTKQRGIEHKRASRNRDDMEIVRFDLKEIL